MAGLSDQLKGVQMDPPTVESEPTPDPAPKEEKGKEKKERSADEVRGELLRKQEKDKAEILGVLSEIRTSINQFRSPPEPQPSDTGTKTIDQMTSVELEAARPTIDWEKASAQEQAQFEALVVSRRESERQDQKLSGFMNTQRLEDQRKEYQSKAIEYHPDLRDSSSELAREVNARLISMDDQSIAANPRVLWDVANEVATEKGLTAKPRRKVDGRRTATSRNAPLEQSTEEPAGMMTDEQRADLARQFERKGALPSGKKFDLDELKKDEAEIRSNMPLHQQRGGRVGGM